MRLISDFPLIIVRTRYFRGHSFVIVLFLTSNQSLLEKMAQTAVTEVNKYNEIRKFMLRRKK